MLKIGGVYLEEVVPPYIEDLSEFNVSGKPLRRVYLENS